jgi:hypothetical protein
VGPVGPALVAAVATGAAQGIVFMGSYAVNAGTANARTRSVVDRAASDNSQGEADLKRKKLKNSAMTTYILLAAVVVAVILVISLSQ